MRKITVLFLIGILFSCENMDVKEITAENSSSQDQNDTVVATNNKIDKQTSRAFKNAVDFVQFCIEKIQSKEIKDLNPYVENGIVFSPNAHIIPSNTRTVGLEELSVPEKTIHYWGIYPGRGDSILLSTSDYLNRFVFNFDLNANHIEINSYDGNPKSRGSELHNIEEQFPEATTVAFYEPPSKEGYMDWNALYFVVQKLEDRFVLKAIVHNQWTP